VVFTAQRPSGLSGWRFRRDSSFGRHRAVPAMPAAARDAASVDAGPAHHRILGTMATVPRPVDKPRPVYLNLLAIRQPLPAIVSFLHRVSGAALFALGLPVALWALQASLASTAGYDHVAAVFASPLAKLVLLGLAWAYLHHLFNGVRHLLGDLDIGLDLASARRSSAVVLVLALLITLALGIRLW
jgi:succinate dehydrogenase / fumarate reductase, cytochrome b subunit